MHARLKTILQSNPDVTRKLRAIWALHVTGGLTDQDAIELLSHENEYVRAWAVQLIAEDRNAPDAALRKFAEMAKADGSALVRLYIASALQRVPAEKRWDAVTALLSRAEDRNDHNQPLMAWYAAEPLGGLDPQRALAMAADSKLPRTFSFMVQRIAGLKTQEALKVLAERLARTTNADEQKELSAGISSDCRGQVAEGCQIPNPKLQIPTALPTSQPPKLTADLEVGGWECVGIWSLGFGICPHSSLRATTGSTRVARSAGT